MIPPAVSTLSSVCTKYFVMFYADVESNLANAPRGLQVIGRPSVGPRDSLSSSLDIIIPIA